MFIVLEGIDGSGTSTQTKLLTEHLLKQGKQVLSTCEPSNGEIGKFIRSCLAGSQKISPLALQFLFCADRAEHLAKEIKPALRENKIVISDRYHLSTVAYASLINKSDFFLDLGKDFLVPDLLIFIDLPVSLALARIQKRGETKELFEKKAKLKKISQAYQKYINKIPAKKVLVIDGQKSIEEIYKLIANEVSKEFFEDKDLRKVEIVDAIVASAGITKKAAATALATLITLVTNELKTGNNVAITGFGTFRVSHRASRTGINPRDRKQRNKTSSTKIPEFEFDKKLLKV